MCESVNECVCVNDKKKCLYYLHTELTKLEELVEDFNLDGEPTGGYIPSSSSSSSKPKKVKSVNNSPNIFSSRYVINLVLEYGPKYPNPKVLIFFFFTVIHYLEENQ